MGKPSRPPQPGVAQLSAQVPTTDMSWSTVRIIVLTAAVVLMLLSIPFLFVVRQFVKFDSVDKYLGLTDGMSPKICGFPMSRDTLREAT